MQYVDVAEKIQTLPEPLLHEVGDFVDFLLARYAQETQPVSDEVPAALLARLAVAGGSFDWLDDPAEDIYSDADGELV